MSHQICLLMLAAMTLAAVGFSARVGAKPRCEQAPDAVRAARSASEAAASARDALILVRRAAQDWKNLLLRGGDPVERPRIQTRFDAQATGYEKQLSVLADRLERVGTGRTLLIQLEEQRKRMFAAYRLALDTRGASDLAAAVLADRDVQGVDVPTFRALEELIAVLDTRVGEQFDQAHEAIGQCGESK